MVGFRRQNHSLHFDQKPTVTCYSFLDDPSMAALVIVITDDRFELSGET